MRKLITVVLILVLLMPSAALAVQESEIVGCYVYYELLTTGAPTMTMFYLGPDHFCYFLIQSYHVGEPGIGRAFVGTWEMQPDGTVFAKTGNNTSMTLIIPDGAPVAYDKDMNRYFINISLYDDLIK